MFKACIAHDLSDSTTPTQLHAKGRGQTTISVIVATLFERKMHWNMLESISPFCHLFRNCCCAKFLKALRLENSGSHGSENQREGGHCPEAIYGQGPKVGGQLEAGRCVVLFLCVSICWMRLDIQFASMQLRYEDFLRY